MRSSRFNAIHAMRVVEPFDVRESERIMELPDPFGKFFEPQSLPTKLPHPPHHKGPRVLKDKERVAGR